MKKVLGMMVVLVTLIALGMACASKKEKEAKKAAKDSPGFALAACPAARIELTPSRVEDPSCVRGSACAVELTATAYDQDGQLLSRPLTFSLRYPDGKEGMVAGGGHQLEILDDHRARFKASGLASGVFTVLCQDRSCNLGTADQPQFPEGEAWIKVYDPPGSPAVCSRMRVTYGDRVDRMGETVIASAKVTLLAEVSAKEKLSRRYRVRFLINGQPFAIKRPVYFDPETAPAPGMKYGYFSFLPIYLVPGEYGVRYELLDQGKAVCSSRTEWFKAK